MPTQDELILRLIYQEENKRVLDDAKDKLAAMTEGEKQVMKQSAQWSDQLKKTNADLIKQTEAMDKGSKSTNILKDTWTEFNSMLNVGERALRAVGQVVDETIGKYMEYAGAVNDLSKNLGTQAEETSRLLGIGKMYGLSIDTMTNALQMAVKKGYAPSVDGLAKLADETNAIADPTKRAATLVEIFGRNWTALTPMLEKGGVAIKNAAKEAENFGAVLTEKDVEATERLEISINKLNMRFDGIKNSISKGVVPALNNLFTLNDDSASATDKLAAAEDALTYAWGEQRKLLQSMIPDLKRKIAAQQQDTAETDGAVRATQRFNDALKPLPPTFSYYTEGVDGAVLALRRMNDAQDAAVKTSARVAGAMADLKLSMSGALKNEQIQFGDREDTLTEKAKKLKDEIDKLSAANGRAVVSTKESTLTDTERIAAQAKLAMVTEDLTNKTRKKNETDAEFTSRMADLSVQSENLTGKINGTTTAVKGYIDNSKKIGELKAEYDDVNKAIDDNARAHEDATHRILFGYAEQQLAVDGYTENEYKALDKLAVTWGLKSVEDIAAMQAIRNAASALATDGNYDAFALAVENSMNRASGAMMGAAGDAAHFKGTLEESIPSAATQLEAVVQSAKNSGLSMAAAAGDAAHFKGEMNALGTDSKIVWGGLDTGVGGVKKSSKAALDEVKNTATGVVDKGNVAISASMLSVTNATVAAKGVAITAIDQINTAWSKVPHDVTTIYHIVQPVPVPTVGHTYQQGGNFTVPPGYPNDSYPLRVSSGEHVTVQPVTNNYNNSMTNNISTDKYGAAVFADRMRQGRAFEARM